MIDADAPPKPPLVIGLGNVLAGDDGVASRLVGHLREHPGLPADVDLLEGCTDLLRMEDEIAGRRRVLLLDALLDPGEPGRLLRFEGDLHELDEHGGTVHQLPPAQALRLLRCLCPGIRDVPVTFLGITIRDVAFSPTLSPALDARLDALAEEVLDLLAGDPAATAGPAPLPVQ